MEFRYLNAGMLSGREKLEELNKRANFHFRLLESSFIHSFQSSEGL